MASALSNRQNCACARKTLLAQRGRTHGAGCVRQWFRTAEPLGERRYENWNTHTHVDYGASTVEPDQTATEEQSDQGQQCLSLANINFLVVNIYGFVHIHNQNQKCLPVICPPGKTQRWMKTKMDESITEMIVAHDYSLIYNYAYIKLLIELYI